jgi:plasmid stabilization system protein ParE
MSGWTAHLTDQAAQDVENILDWTYEQFGPLQMDAYTAVINDALEALTGGPQTSNVGANSHLAHQRHAQRPTELNRLDVLANGASSGVTAFAGGGVGGFLSLEKAKSIQSVIHAL